MLLLFNTDIDNVDLRLNGERFKVCKRATHLSSSIEQHSNEDNIAKAYQDIIFRTNIFMSEFGFSSTHVRLAVFTT